VARHWRLPEALQRCMRRPETHSPPLPLAPGPERLRWLAVAANEMSDALWQADEATLAARLEAVAQRHGRALGLTLQDLRRATGDARQVLAQMASAMGLTLPLGSPGQKVLAHGAAPDPRDSLLPHQLVATQNLLPGGAGAEEPTLLLPAVATAGGPLPATAPALNPAVTDMLAAGIQDITDTLAGDSFHLNEVLRMVLETMYRALGFQRMVFCLRDAASGQIKGRFGLGERAAALSPVFQVPLRWPAGQAPDLFGAVCLKGSDTLIADSRAPSISPRLPAWYREQVDAPSFLLLPMMMRGAPFALIYADQTQAGGLQLADRELALLRTLRNQAVMAFRQASHAL
jgi:hypothetical protein